MTEQDPISLDARTQIDSDPSPLVGSEAPPNPDLPEIVAEQPAEIPVEELAPVIDIHPPQHGSITRRDFFVHLFIVVLSIPSPSASNNRSSTFTTAINWPKHAPSLPPNIRSTSPCTAPSALSS